jgi:hypothetical protein
LLHCLIVEYNRDRFVYQTGEIVSLEGDRLPARLYALTNGLTNGLLKKSENSLKTDL